MPTTVEPQQISRTALRFYGGKASIAPWIINHFPPHAAYVEPFGGGASVLLKKPPAPLETYNDLDRAIVTFFRVLRDQPDALIRAIQLTPFARAEMDGSDVDDSTITDLERARRVYVRSGQCQHGLPARGQMGWRFDVGALTGNGTNIKMWNKTEHLYAVAARLKAVQIECWPAAKVIARHADQPDTLFYVDPPYVPATRGARWAKVGYDREMTDADHEALAAQLHAVSGMVVLSGYHSPLYDRLYGDWTRSERTSRTQAGKRATEVVWRNPAAVARANDALPLFRSGA